MDGAEWAVWSSQTTDSCLQQESVSLLVERADKENEKELLCVAPTPF